MKGDGVDRPLGWRTAFLGGFLGLAVCSYLVARLPWALVHWIVAGLLVVLAMAVIQGLGNLERGHPSGPALRPSLRWPAALVLILAGAFASHTAVFTLGYYRYASTRAAVQSAGLDLPSPKTEIELDTARNGMPELVAFYTSAGFTKTAHGEGSGSHPGGLVPLCMDALKLARREPGADPRALDVLRRHAKELEAAVQAIAVAHKAPRFLWNVRYDVPVFQIQWPRIGGLMDLGRMAAGQALLLEQDGDSAGAQSLLLDCLWLAEQARKTGGLVGAMVSTQIESAAIDAALPLIRRGQGGVFLQSLGEGGAASAVDRALQWEYLNAPEGFLQAIFGGLRSSLLREPSLKRLIATGAGSFVGGLCSILSFRPDVAGKAQGARTVGASGWPANVFDLMFFPWVFWQASDWIRDGASLIPCMAEDPLASEACFHERMDSMSREGWFVESMAVPKYGSMHLKGALATVRERLARTAYAMVRYRRAKGHWPSSLAELDLGSAAVNPFNQKPFVFRMVAGKPELCFFGRGGALADGSMGQFTDRDIIVRL
jgi:hypothetical protein